MTMLHVFMEIDTCPMCGAEIYFEENGHLGKGLEEIPNDAVFKASRTEVYGGETVVQCGTFVVSKRDKDSDKNDWVCEFIPVERNWPVNNNDAIEAYQKFQQEKLNRSDPAE